MTQIRTLGPDEKIKRLQECVVYHMGDGTFTWLKRPASHFATPRAWKIWNIRFAGKPALQGIDRGYAYGRIDGVKVYAHRAAWALCNGEFPVEIDHIDGNPSNNRIENLRPADRFTNNCNVRSAKNSSSRFLGVHWSNKDGRWVAQITKNGVKKVIGYFRNEADAAKAYDAAALVVHGDFAHPNFRRASCK